MPKLRMIVYKDDGEVMGHKDFRVADSSIKDDPIIDCMRTAMRDQIFVQEFELVLNNRQSLKARLEELVDAVDILCDAYFTGKVDGVTVLDTLRRLRTGYAKSIIAEAGMVNTKVLGISSSCMDAICPLVTLEGAKLVVEKDAQNAADMMNALNHVTIPGMKLEDDDD